MIDRYGSCPNCNRNWGGKDIYEHVNNMSVFQHKDEEETKEVAKAFGWREDSPTKFSHVKVHEIKGVTVLECPNMLCGHVFDAQTGKEYASIYDYKIGRIFERKPVINHVTPLGETLESIDREIKEFNQRQKDHPSFEPLDDLPF